MHSRGRQCRTRRAVPRAKRQAEGVRSLTLDTPLRYAFHRKAIRLRRAGCQLDC